MRTKHFILILCCVVLTTIILIVLGPVGEPNDSFKSIVTHTHQQFNKLQENLRVAEQKKLEIDPKYLAILGFISSNSLYSAAANAGERAAAAASSSSVTKQSQYYKYDTQDPQHNSQHNAQSNSAAQQQQQQQQPQSNFNSNSNNNKEEYEIRQLPLQQPYDPDSSQQQQQQQQHNNNINIRPSKSQKHRTIPHVTTTPFNGTKANFTIVTYVQDGQAPSAILLSQNIAAKFPNEYLLIYDLGLSEDDSRALSAYCNSSKCSVIGYDLSVFPSHVTDQRMHAYRPIVIKDALMRSKSILFAENSIRIRGTSHDLNDLHNQVIVSGVLGWNTPTAVSQRTHPKMFDYFQTDADDFIFLRMVDLDVVLFADNLFVTEKIMLPWIKCALTLECIDPIGAQSNGCKYNKKPQYRYSGCHSYDTSAFNIVLGLTWHLDDTKYSLPSDTYNNIFYKETLEQATKILENRRRNSSETSEHPFSEE